MRAVSLYSSTLDVVNSWAKGAGVDFKTTLGITPTLVSMLRLQVGLTVISVSTSGVTRKLKDPSHSKVTSKIELKLHAFKRLRT